jgi:hypothetical protein
MRLLQTQVILTVFLAALVGLMLSMIVALDHPFTGGSAVTSEAFAAARAEIDRGLAR